jgi:hypothetical protein
MVIMGFKWIFNWGCNWGWRVQILVMEDSNGIAIASNGIRSNQLVVFQNYLLRNEEIFK